MTATAVQPDLTDEQVMFRDATVRFIESELPVARTRDLHDHPCGFERSWLQQAAQLGWFAMLVPEADGGGSVSGSGLADAAMLAEDVGRYVQPGPFTPMNVVAYAIGSAGSDVQRARWLTGIATGEIVATWAFAAEDGSWDAGAGVRVTRAGSSLTADGVRGVVQDAQSADVVVVVATLDGEPVQLIVPADAAGLTFEALERLDLSRRFAHVRLDNVDLTQDAVLAGGRDLLEQQLVRAVVLNCADTVGAADTLFATTVAYAGDRIAFGRPIGSFQAVKHILADRALYLETCKAAVTAAVTAVARGDEDAAAVASMAAAYVGDVANDIAQQCLQVHGGIGYTWEHDLHLYLRRIRSNAALYGEPTWHRERVCTLSGLGADR